ncbi:hypothetical protein N7513_002327 [Penicillium frequentans]|nr:hypothetical protein N7513_002327 [Penicillium glabrum]
MPVNEVINTATIGAATAVVGFLTKGSLPEPNPPAEGRPVENEENELPEPLLIPSKDTNVIQDVRERTPYSYKDDSEIPRAPFYSEKYTHRPQTRDKNSVREL